MCCFCSKKHHKNLSVGRKHRFVRHRSKKTLVISSLGPSLKSKAFMISIGKNQQKWNWLNGLIFFRNKQKSPRDL